MDFLKGLISYPIKCVIVLVAILGLSRLAVVASYRHQDIFIIEALTVAGTAVLAIHSSDAPFAFKVIDMFAISELTGAGDTVKLTDGTNDIIAAISTATIDLLTRATDIDLTYASIAAGGSLELETASGAAARVFITCVATN